MPGAEQVLGVLTGEENQLRTPSGGSECPLGQKQVITTGCCGQFTAVTMSPLLFSLTVSSQHGLRGAQPNFPQSWDSQM